MPNHSLSASSHYDASQLISYAYFSEVRTQGQDRGMPPALLIATV